MKQYILALDQGTTTSRSLVFDSQGEIISSSKEEFHQFFPASDKVEHDAMEIWDTQLRTIKTALRDAKFSINDIACIGIANQRETVLIWDKKSGEPLHNAIVWQDKRTSDFMSRLRDEGKESLIGDKTGLVLDPYFSASKLRWLLDNVPGARAKAAAGELAAGTMDTWLIYKLTGGKILITDITNAARTMLFNIHTCKWDKELLELFDIPAAVLPKVVSSSLPFEGAPITSKKIIGGEVAITGIAGDQHAALLGQGCTKPGMIKNTYGTGCFMLIHTGDTPLKSKNNLLTTIAWQLPGQKPQYALEGSIFIGGSVIQWLRDGLKLIKSAPEVNQLAAEDNGGVYFVPAFVGLGSPHWDAEARGMIIGITRGTTGGHLARAALESIAFQSVELAQAMAADMDSGEENELRADGGVTASELFMQIQSDLLGAPIKTARIEETTALGAAYFAGLSLGIWKDLEHIYSSWQEGGIYEPKIDTASRTEMLARWSEAVKRSKGWA